MLPNKPYDMTRVFLTVIIVLCLSGCARERHVVKSIPQPLKKLVIPDKITDPSFRPYDINGEKYYPLPSADGFVQYGKVSWYGKKFHGRPTASGEIYDMYKKSAAHKTLPLGTIVKVINLDNNRETVVRINDRGPFVKGRIIDLSYATAKEIGLVRQGVARAKIIALGKEVGKLKSPQGLKPVLEVGSLTKGEFVVQIGAFKKKENALRLADRLGVIFNYVDITIFDDAYRGTLYRLRVSKSKTLEEAGRAERKLENMGFKEAFVVSL